MPALSLLLLLLLVGGPAWGQAVPVCIPAREGMIACFGDRLCACRWQPGGTLTGRPAGYRWDCGVLRPACGVAPAGPPPVALPYLPGGLPPVAPPESFSPWPR